MVIIVRVLIRRARSIRRGRRYIVSLSVLISVVVLLQRSDGRRRGDVRRGSLIIRVVVIIIAVVAVLTGNSWRRRGGRRRITITVVRLLPADLSNAANLLLGVLIHVLLVRLLGLVFVLIIVSVVEITATATSQYVAIVVVVGRRHSIHRISGGSHRVAGLAALKVILGLGVATKIIVVHGLKTGTDSI